MSKFKLALFATVALFAAPQAMAATAVTIANPTGVTLANPPFTLGWTFRAGDNPLLVSDLGIFDSGQNGLVNSHQIGLWNSTGTLLASTTLASGASGTLINQFRYNSIAPTLLAAGQQYFIGALYATGADPVVFTATGLTADPSLTYLNGTFAAGATLTNPTVTFGGNNNFFGPNFIFAAVPEPATWAMLILGFGMVGGAMRYGKRSTRVTFATA